MYRPVRAGPVTTSRKLQETSRSVGQREARNRREGLAWHQHIRFAVMPLRGRAMPEHRMRRLLTSGSSRWQKAPQGGEGQYTLYSCTLETMALDLPWTPVCICSPCVLPTSLQRPSTMATVVPCPPTKRDSQTPGPCDLRPISPSISS